MVNPLVDPTWRFMTLDWDGKIRMDCSSPNAMASLIGKIGDYDIATGNDADADRHGIVTPDAGLMNPNHYLAVAIDYLYTHRPDWPDTVARRQDAGRQLDDRPGGGRHRPQAGRGAGRLQVVRARTDRRLDRLRRRGVGGRVVPAQGRHHLDHRQGRHPPGAAGLGDPGRHRQDRRRSATPSSPRSTATRRTPASTHPPTASRRPSWASCRPRRSAPPSWPASRSPPS